MEHLSFANRFIGMKIIQNSHSSHRFLKPIQARLFVLALPIFHLLDTAYYLGHYATALTQKRMVRLDHEDIQRSACLRLARSHFASIFTSIPVGLVQPAKALKWDEQKMDFPERAITYEIYPHSRLGDNLSCFLDAKWVAHKTRLPLIVRSFPHANELALSKNHIYRIAQHHPLVASCKPFSYEEFEKNPAAPGIWKVPFMAQFQAKIDWRDEEFRSSVLKDLALIDPKILPPLVPDRVNMALHVRTGGDFDSPNATYYYPTKIPPRAFFDEGLKLALSQYGNKPVHVQIYTDAVDPEKELEHYRQFANKHHPNITISTAAKARQTESQVTSDMIAMSRYECLIRADSGLSKQSSLIGKPALEIMPRSYHIQGDLIRLEGFHIVNRDKEQNRVLNETHQDLDLPITYSYTPKALERAGFYAHHRKIVGENQVRFQ